MPLKIMCSMKCEMPPSAAGSYRLPLPTQMPTDAVRTVSSFSEIRRTPLGRTRLTYMLIHKPFCMG